MNIEIRKAVTSDAESVEQLAFDTSKKVLEESGADVNELSEKGFLMYPLAASDVNRSNYRERIETSDHFWVAVDNEQVVGFLMAYTFECMASLKQKTENDESTVEYFVNRMGFRDSGIYLAQAAVSGTLRKTGLGQRIISNALQKIRGDVHPAAFAEIAQSPIFNKASSQSAFRSGFAPLALRQKDGNRLSCTFVKTFAAKKHNLPGPIIS